jgi:hypothetical protein
MELNLFHKKQKPHEHRYDSMVTLEHLWLKDGHHTGFIALKCQCGHLTGFPIDNLKLALNEGTPETIAYLTQYGFKE